MRPAPPGRRRDPPEEQPVDDRGHRVGPLVEGVEHDAGPEGDDAARDRPGQQPHPVDGERQEAGREQQRREGEDAGLDGVVEDRHLEDQAADPVRGDVRDLEADVGAQGRAADDGLVGTEVVEQGHDLLGEGGHRVDERVGRAGRTGRARAGPG